MAALARGPLPYGTSFRLSITNAVHSELANTKAGTAESDRVVLFELPCGLHSHCGSAWIHRCTAAPTGLSASTAAVKVSPDFPRNALAGGQKQAEYMQRRPNIQDGKECVKGHFEVAEGLPSYSCSLLGGA